MTVAAWSPLEIPASNAQPSRSASVEKLRRLEKLPEGLDGWADKAQGWFKRRPSEAAFLWTDAQRCAQLCAQFAELDTEALQHAKVMAQENLRRDPMLAITIAGFPHSEIPGSKLTYSSPRLIAVRHVLHRLLMPRHSPHALIFFYIFKCEIIIS